MGDGTVQKIAIVLNSDAEHIDNQNQFIWLVREEDPEFQIYATCPVARLPESKGNTHYFEASPEGFKRLLRGLPKTDDDDIVSIYLVGQGTYLHLSLTALRDTLEGKRHRYGKRIVYMEGFRNATGVWSLFADPKTTVLSLEPGDDPVFPMRFNSRLFALSAEVPDLDQDGIRTIAERMAYAASLADPGPLLHYYNPGGVPVSFAGKEDQKPSFEAKVIAVESAAELEKQLARLNPDVHDMALVTFSADWCGPCQFYKKDFEALAKQFGGHVLMLRLEGKEGSEKEWATIYGIRSFPTVMRIDAKGNRTIVDAPMPSKPTGAVVPDKDPLDFEESVARIAAMPPLTLKSNADKPKMDALLTLSYLMVSRNVPLDTILQLAEPFRANADANLYNCFLTIIMAYFLASETPHGFAQAFRIPPLMTDIVWKGMAIQKIASIVLEMGWTKRQIRRKTRDWPEYDQSLLHRFLEVEAELGR